MLSRILAALLFVSLTWSPVSAEVVRIQVTSRADVAGGKAFGATGPYEKIAGRIYFEVDPSLSPNKIITDIDKAPKNARGRVEFSSDFFLLKPKQVERGNGTVLYEVSNRGGKGMLAFYNQAAGSLDPTTDAQMGDGFLMAQGFTLLWVGWQFDPPHREGLVRVFAPIATDNGKPITGIVRSEVIVAKVTPDSSLADRDHIAYTVANPNDPANTLTVRDTIEGARRFIQKSEWRLDSGRVYLTGGFQPGKIYEVVYKAQDPPVAGTGLAAVRDAIAYLKYAPPLAGDPLSIPAGTIQRAIAFGVSQSGRLLRTYLYYGFNEDEQHRKVFDGVMAHVAGGGRGSFNLRFSQPSRDGHPFLNKFYPTDIFPFTDAPQTDPQTGEKDGLLSRVKAEHTPKIFYTNSSYEYWGRAASLIHTTIDGAADAPLMDNVRVYLLTAGQHGPSGFPPAQTIGQQRNNPLDYRWAMKALLVAMDRWTATGTAPPPSQYPHIGDGTLVRPDRLKFPKVPGVTTTAAVHRAYRADYGPRFGSEGIVTVEPPRIGTAFPVLVPQVDADGNGVAGIRMPEVTVPLATYTGWNLFNDRSGPTDVLSSMQGSYIPLPRTAADRKRTGDPRPSIEERYRDRDQYLGLVSKAAQALVDQRFLLAEDAATVVTHAGRHWDYIASTPASTAGVEKR